MGVPQLLPLPLPPPELVSVLVCLHQDVPRRRQLLPPKELQLPLAKLLRPLVLLTVRPRLRVHVLLLRLPQQLQVVQPLKVAALVLVDLPLLVRLVLVHHVAAPGGAKVRPLHHPPVPALLLLAALPLLPLLLAGVLAGVLGKEVLRLPHQKVGTGVEWPPLAFA